VRGGKRRKPIVILHRRRKQRDKPKQKKGRFVWELLRDPVENRNGNKRGGARNSSQEKRKYWGRPTTKPQPKGET